jgi:hypothetical protein
MEEKEKNVTKINHSEHTIFWLKEGPNTFGSGDRNNFIFPEYVSGYAGIFFLKGNRVNIRTAESANITHNGASIDGCVIYEAGKSLLLEAPNLEFQVVSYDGKLAVEVKEKTKLMA